MVSIYFCHVSVHICIYIYIYIYIVYEQKKVPVHNKKKLHNMILTCTLAISCSANMCLDMFPSLPVNIRNLYVHAVHCMHKLPCACTESSDSALHRTEQIAKTIEFGPKVAYNFCGMSILYKLQFH